MDGLHFQNGVTHLSDLTWDSLTNKGVMVKPTAPVAEQRVEEEDSLPLHIDEAIDMSGMIEERSLMIE